MKLLFRCQQNHGGKCDVSPCTTPCTFCVCYRRIRCQCHCDFWVRDWGCGCGWGVIWFERYVLQDFPRVQAGSEFWIRKRGNCRTIHGRTNLLSILYASYAIWSWSKHDKWRSYVFCPKALQWESDIVTTTLRQKLDIVITWQPWFGFLIE